MWIIRLLYIAGGSLFSLSVIAHICVRVLLRPKDESEVDDYYYELEDLHPGYARYAKWLHVTLAGAVLGVLLFFVAVIV